MKLIQDVVVNKTNMYNCLECGKCRAACPISWFNYEYSPRLIVEKALEGMIDHQSKEIWYCMCCGACEDACPSEIDFTDFITTLRAKAIRSGANIEERLSELEKIFLEGEMDKDIGIIREITAGKSKIEGQDGGIVTSMLTAGMEKGLFNTAVVVQRETGPAQATIAENIPDIMEAKGSKYLLAKTVDKLVEAVIEKDKREIAIAGLPCEVQGVREIQKNLLNSDIKITVIGLFCMENFIHEALKQELKNILQVDLDRAKKVDIKKNEFIFYNGKKLSCKVDELYNAVRRNCAYCIDFTARLADISVGSVGSPDGYSTIIVRSKRGEELMESLGKFERVEVNRDEIARLAFFKKKKSLQKLEEKIATI